jgi:hypothetical protein
MFRHSQNRWLTIVSRPAFLATSAAVVALGGSNAALLSLLHPYERPETVTAIVAAVDLVRTLSNVWLGVSSLCWMPGIQQSYSL